MSGSDKADVGYGRPPTATRFRKGQSGNPRGRPRGSRNVGSLISAALESTVVINENGKRRKVSKMEAAFMQQANKAAAGDGKAMRLIMDLLNAYNPSDATPDKETAEARRASDLKTLAVFAARLKGGDYEDAN